MEQSLDTIKEELQSQSAAASSVLLLTRTTLICKRAACACFFEEVKLTNMFCSTDEEKMGYVEKLLPIGSKVVAKIV